MSRSISPGEHLRAPVPAARLGAPTNPVCTGEGGLCGADWSGRTPSECPSAATPPPNRGARCRQSVRGTPVGRTTKRSPEVGRLGGRGRATSGSASTRSHQRAEPPACLKCEQVSSPLRTRTSGRARAASAILRLLAASSERSRYIPGEGSVFGQHLLRLPAEPKADVSRWGDRLAVDVAPAHRPLPRGPLPARPLRVRRPQL